MTEYNLKNIQTLKDTIHKANDIIILHDQLKPSLPEYSFWIPFLSALAGGLLVLIGQSIDRYYKNKSSSKDAIREIYSYCRKLEVQMINQCSQLAYFRMRYIYRLFCYKKIIPTNDIYYKEQVQHLESSRNIENKIGEIKADFVGHIRKFQAIQPLKLEIENDLLVIINAIFIKPQEYNLNSNVQEVYDKVEEDEAILREEYLKNILVYKKINDYLQSLL